jgi:hypothetical protein
VPISWTESPSPRTCEVTSTIDQLLSHLHHSQQPGYPPSYCKWSNWAFRVLDSRRSNGRRSSLDCSSTSITRHVVPVVAFTQPCACSSAISKCNRSDDSTSQVPSMKRHLNDTQKCTLQEKQCRPVQLPLREVDAVLYRLIFFRVRPAKPSRPMPSSIRLDGSGVDTDVRLGLYAKP